MQIAPQGLLRGPQMDPIISLWGGNLAVNCIGEPLGVPNGAKLNQNGNKVYFYGGIPPKIYRKSTGKTAEIGRNFGRVWILAFTPKLKNKNDRAFRPVFLTFGEAFQQAEYRPLIAQRKPAKRQKENNNMYTPARWRDLRGSATGYIYIYI